MILCLRFLCYNLCIIIITPRLDSLGVYIIDITSLAKKVDTSIPILVGVLNCIDKPYTVTDNDVHYINGSYNQGIFSGYTAFLPPSGYSLKFRIIWSATTTANNTLYLYVNGFECGHLSTYSAKTFIQSVTSNYFDESVFSTEGTYNYTDIKGTNIKIQNKGDQATATLYSMLCCIYWVKN